VPTGTYGGYASEWIFFGDERAGGWEAASTADAATPLVFRNGTAERLWWCHSGGARGASTQVNVYDAWAVPAGLPTIFRSAAGREESTWEQQVAVDAAALAPPVGGGGHAYLAAPGGVGESRLSG